MEKSELNNAESLWRKALQKTKESIANCALVPLRTKLINIIDSDSVRSNYELRELISEEPPHIKFNTQSNNPFKPWDNRLEIEHIGIFQVCLRKIRLF